jgi:hypothetical protein
MANRGWRQLLNDIFRGRTPEREGTAMERIWDPRLDDLGVRLEAPAEAEYRLVEANWVDPSEANDKRHIYVRVLDKDGTPLEGQRFRVTNGSVHIERTKGPGFDQYWGNYPMYGGGVYAVDIPDATSDRLSHMVTGSKSDPFRQSCYVLVFQRGVEVALPPTPPPTPPPDPGPTPDPDPGVTLDEATRARLLGLLDQAEAELNAARVLLEG